MRSEALCASSSGGRADGAGGFPRAGVTRPETGEGGAFECGCKEHGLGERCGLCAGPQVLVGWRPVAARPQREGAGSREGGWTRVHLRGGGAKKRTQGG